MKDGQPKYPGRKIATMKPKDLVGNPWATAFALRADGWYLRSEITWCKKAPMPESVTDRPTSATEKIFLLTKSAHYYYDQDAVREPAKEWTGSAATFKRENSSRGQVLVPGQAHGTHRPDRKDTEYNPAGRNLWNYWLLSPEPVKEAHFATFPTEIPRRAILAGTSPQACPKCGTPWARVVERKSHPNWQSDRPQKHDGTYYRPNPGGGVGNDKRARRELGWRSTCTCEDNDGAGVCTVLDPFAGSGTTLLVAAQLGRQAIGSELNLEYVDIMRQRLSSAKAQRKLSF